MFSLQGQDKISVITVSMGLLASTAAVAHGLINQNLSTLGIGIFALCVFAYGLHLLRRDNQHG
jgi:hypothetical protein